jgi:hypothetical protein
MAQAGSADEHGSVTRLLVLCARPAHLTGDEADEWLRSEVRELLADHGVTRIDFVLLASASVAWGRQWDYLIEIDLRDGTNPNALVRSPSCAGLLGDLRLLGMRPTVLVVDDDRAISVMRDRE